MVKKAKKAADLKVGNSLTKVLLIDNQLLRAEDTNKLSIIKINLPRKISSFVKSSNGEIFELMQFNEQFRSWFIDDTVSSCGKIFVTSKIDPLFIFLQYLELNCMEKAQPLDQILEGAAEIFTDSLKLSQMNLVADQKGPDDLKAFKFNREKTLKWLRKKFELTKNSLIQKRIVSSGASSSNFVKSSLDPADEVSDIEAVNETALGIISEYISLDLSEELDQLLGISEKSTSKRKSGVAIGGDVKRIKVEEQENSPTKPNVQQQAAKVTVKAAKLEKAAKGSKSISSFFAKK